MRGWGSDEMVDHIKISRPLASLCRSSQSSKIYLILKKTFALRIHHHPQNIMAYVRAQSFKTKRYIDETFDDDFDNLVPHWLDSADRRSIWQNLSNHQESLKSLQNLIGVGLGSLARTDPESYKPTLRYYILFNDLPTLLQAPHVSQLDFYRSKSGY